MILICTGSVSDVKTHNDRTWITLKVRKDLDIYSIVLDSVPEYKINMVPGHSYRVSGLIHEVSMINEEPTFIIDVLDYNEVI